MPPLQDEYEGFDTDAAAADIGADLFGSANPVADSPGHNEGGDGTDLTPGNTDANAQPAAAEKPSPAPVAAVPPANTPAVDPNAPANNQAAAQQGQNSVAKVLPKSWKKDMGPEWEKLSPQVKDYVYEREANVMRGIQQYQNGYQAWTNLIQPFAPLLQSYPQVNPVQLMQGLMQTHLALLDPQAAPEKKAEIVNQLLLEYGINMTTDQVPAVDPAVMQRIQRQEQMIQQLVAQQQNNQRQAYQQGINTYMQQVDAFGNDPANKFFGEVQDDILRFLNSGVADSLKGAYDLAIWANPAVRAKVIAEQQQPARPTAPAPRAKNGQFVNLDDNTPPSNRKPKVGSIDDTIDAVVAANYSKH